MSGLLYPKPSRVPGPAALGLIVVLSVAVVPDTSAQRLRGPIDEVLTEEGEPHDVATVAGLTAYSYYEEEPDGGYRLRTYLANRDSIHAVCGLYVYRDRYTAEKLRERIDSLTVASAHLLTTYPDGMTKYRLNRWQPAYAYVRLMEKRAPSDGSPVYVVSLTLITAEADKAHPEVSNLGLLGGDISGGGAEWPSDPLASAAYAAGFVLGFALESALSAVLAFALCVILAFLGHRWHRRSTGVEPYAGRAAALRVAALCGAIWSLCIPFIDNAEDGEAWILAALTVVAILAVWGLARLLSPSQRTLREGWRRLTVLLAVGVWGYCAVTLGSEALDGLDPVFNLVGVLLIAGPVYALLTVGSVFAVARVLRWVRAGFRTSVAEA